MLARNNHEDPHTLYARFVRDCITVARFSTTETRRQFLSQYEEVLGGGGIWLRNLPHTHQERLFRDAVRLREGGLPQTPAGLRLAIPRWFTRRIYHPLEVWTEAAGFRPTGPSIEPPSFLCVDPGTTQSSDPVCDVCVEPAKAA